MTTLSKNKIKYIRSLETKKARKEENVFLAEGTTLVQDLIGHFEWEIIIATSQWVETPRDVQAKDVIDVT